MSGSGPRSSHRERQRQETRQRVYEAALAIFQRDGVQDARIADITQRAEVSYGAFYFHFPDKDDVLREFNYRSEVEVAEVLRTLPPHTPISEVLECAARAIGLRWEASPALYSAAGLVVLKSLTESDAVHGTSPVRQELAIRMTTAVAESGLMPLLPSALLSDMFLVNVFSAALVWGVQTSGPLHPWLQGVCHLFLHGAASMLQDCDGMSSAEKVPAEGEISPMIKAGPPAMQSSDATAPTSEGAPVSLPPTEHPSPFQEAL